MKLSRTILVPLVVVVAGGLALADARSDSDTALAITRAAQSFGWIVRYLPPDPCSPPDPCHAKVALFVDADERADLDQVVTFRHHDGDSINPCIRVLHRFLADGSMAEQIHILDPNDAVKITVPTGYQIVPAPGGYTIAPITPIGDVAP